MKFTPQRAVLLLVLGLGLIGLVHAEPAQVGRNSLVAAPDTAFGVVHLRENDQGACVVIHKTDTVTVSKATRPFFNLVVVNDCASQVYVSVSDFSHYTVPGATDPIETPAADRRRVAPPNSVSNNLRLKVRSDATVGLWNYNLRINDAIVDPKLGIDP